ncbi:MAG: hypothetical protein K2P15_01120, partial [Oscillospiraceae bacterium]|nr:hypothetical protein [Oscillospiraceae bacterium]
SRPRRGRTKLCRLAKELSGGETLFHLIAQRRTNAVKSLLLQNDLPISAAAKAVCIISELKARK